MPNSDFNPYGYFQTSGLPTTLQADSFSEAILYLVPNGTSKIFALIGATGRATAKQPAHGYHQKRMNFVTVVASTGETAGATTINLNDVKGIVPGVLLMNVTTKEIMLVLTVPDPNGTTITVERGAGSIVAATIAASEKLISVGTSYTRRSERPQARSINPVYVQTYTQIWRSAWALSDTDRATYTEGGWENVAENQRDAMLMHSQDIEQTLLWGQSKAPYGDPPRHSTQGIIDAVRVNAPNNYFTAGATTSYQEMVTFLEPAFAWDADYQSVGQRVAFMDNLSMRVFNDIGLNFGTIHITQEESSFGMAFQKMVFYKGAVFLLNHPLINGFDATPGLCVVTDLPSMKMAYMDGRDVKMEFYDGSSDSTGNGIDAVGGSLTSEAATEFRNPEGCVVIEGLTAAATT